MKNPLIIIGLPILAIILIVFFMYASVNNEEKQKLNNFKASQKNIENVHSAMWGIIKGQAQVTEKYKQGFDSIYTKMIEGRYQQGDGSLMKWVTESNPNFDTSLYNRLSQSIEEQRVLLREEQKRLLSIASDYNTFISTIPNNLFLSGKEPLEAKIITSTRSKNAINTGVDDDLNVF